MASSSRNGARLSHEFVRYNWNDPNTRLGEATPLLASYQSEQKEKGGLKCSLRQGMEPDTIAGLLALALPYLHLNESSRYPLVTRALRRRCHRTGCRTSASNGGGSQESGDERGGAHEPTQREGGLVRGRQR